MNHRSRSRRSRPWLPIGLCCALCACTASAQNPRGPEIRAGLVVALERGALDGGFPVLPGCEDYGRLSGGTAGRMSAGAIFSLPSLLEPLGLSARIGVSRSDIRFASPSSEYWYFDPVTISERIADRDFVHDFSATSLEIDLTAGMNVAEGFHISIGPRFIRPISFSAGTTERVHGVAGEQKVLHEAPPVHPAPIAIEGIVTGSYMIPLRDPLSLLVGLSATGEPAPLLRDQGTWKFGIEGSVGLILDISNHDRQTAGTELPRVPRWEPNPGQLPGRPIAEVTPPRRTRLNATLSITGIGDGGEPRDTATVRLLEIRETTRIVFDPVVSFEPGSARPSSIRPSDHDLRAARSGLDSLRFADVASIRRQTLNIVGSRMRERPAAILRLGTGISESDNDGGALDSGRLAAVQEYLRTIWEIAPARVVPNPVEQEAPDELRLASDDPELLAPVVVHDTRRRIGSPLVKLEPTYQADGGLREWSLVLTHRADTVAAYSSREPAGGTGTDDRWRPGYEELAGGAAHLDASFTVVDSAGERFTARAKIPLHTDRRMIAVERTVDIPRKSEEISYRISEPLDPADTIDRDAVREIAETLPEDAVVRIIGVADGNGAARRAMEEHVRGLAAAIAETARRNGARVGGISSGVEPAGEGGDGGSTEGQVTVLIRGVP